MEKISSSFLSALPTFRSRLTLTVSIVLVALFCIALSLAGYVQPVVMGLVQGLGEFLPISSSAHLVLIPWFFEWTDPGLTFDVALHLGTLVALFGYFWRDWFDLLRAAPGFMRWMIGFARGDRMRKRTPSEHIISSIVIATIPGAIAGMLLKDLAEESLRSPLLISVTLAALGLLLYVADRRRPNRKLLERISWRDSLLIGLAQACALIPGVSRSGATISMGRLLCLDRATAARYSFLLSAPITAAAVVFKLPDILTIPRNEVDTFLVGMFVSALVGGLTVHFLLEYVRRAGFGVFAIYRIALAAVIVLLTVVRGA